MSLFVCQPTQQPLRFVTGHTGAPLMIVSNPWATAASTEWQVLGNCAPKEASPLGLLSSGLKQETI